MRKRTKKHRIIHRNFGKEMPVSLKDEIDTVEEGERGRKMWGGKDGSKVECLILLTFILIYLAA